MSGGHVSDQQLSLLVDASLSLAAREAVVAHIRACPTCAERHDRLIDTTATLRLAGSISWSPAHTDATLARLQPDTRRHNRLQRRLCERDWSLPVASAVALAGLIGVLLAPFGVGATVAKAPANAAALLSLGLPVSGHALTVLAAAVAIGCLAYPLSRSR